MIRVYFNAILLVLLLVLSHALVWYMDRDLYHAQVDRMREIKKLPPERMKVQRLEIEANQRKGLEEYRRIKGLDNYVQIPLDRAFDYYLRDRK